MERWISLFGFVFFLFLSWTLSNNRKVIPWRVIIWGTSLQFLFAVLILGVPALNIPGALGFFFSWANDAFMSLLKFTDAGSDFVFGPLNIPEKSNGFIFAIKVLPTIIFFSSLMAVGYHFGILQRVVQGISVVMEKTMGTSGAETLSSSANIFLGQTEAPLLIRPYLRGLTNSELFAIMVGGMANVAGGVLAAYVGLLKDRIPDIAGHLLTASVLSAPASLVVAKLMFPETQKPKTAEGGKVDADIALDINVLEAAARGASEGLKLAVNVGAMLIAFIALVAMTNAILGWAGNLISFPTWGATWVPEALKVNGQVVLSMQVILGWIFAPMAWITGIPWAEAPVIGALLGEKIVLNEFVAYLHLAELSHSLSDRTFVIASYSLCGFANFSSIAIQIGGIGALVPERTKDLAALGVRAVIGGAITTSIIACVAGFLL